MTIGSDRKPNKITGKLPVETKKGTTWMVSYDSCVLGHYKHCTFRMYQLITSRFSDSVASFLFLSEKLYTYIYTLFLGVRKGLNYMFLIKLCLVFGFIFSIMIFRRSSFASSYRNFRTLLTNLSRVHDDLSYFYI